MSEPQKIKSPFAEDGERREIPLTTSEHGHFSQLLGFPPECAQNLEDGGKAPDIEDMNGVLHLLSSAVQYNQAGGVYEFDPELAAAIGGYPVGAVVKKASGDGFWHNEVNGNTANPDLNGSGWASYSPDTNVANARILGEKIIGDVDLSSISGYARAPQGCAYIKQGANEYLFICQPVSGTAHEASERQVIAQMAWSDSGNFTIVSKSSPINIGHGQDISARIENGEIVIYSREECLEGFGYGLSGKGISRIVWRGNATSQSDVVSYTLFGQPDNMMDTFSDMCYCTPAVSPDGKLVFIGQSKTDVTEFANSGRHLIVYNLADVLAAEDPKTLQPLGAYHIPVDRKLSQGIVLQGLCADNNYIYAYYGDWSPFGAHTVQVLDYHGNCIRTIGVDDARHGYSKDDLLNHPNGWLPTQFEPEGITIRNGQLVLLSQVAFRTGSTIRAYKNGNVNYGCIQSNTGHLPYEYEYWTPTQLEASGDYDPEEACTAGTIVQVRKVISVLAPFANGMHFAGGGRWRRECGASIPLFPNAIELATRRGDDIALGYHDASTNEYFLGTGHFGGRLLHVYDTRDGSDYYKAVKVGADFSQGRSRGVFYVENEPVFAAGNSADDTLEDTVEFYKKLKANGGWVSPDTLLERGYKRRPIAELDNNFADRAAIMASAGLSHLRPTAMAMSATRIYVQFCGSITADPANSKKVIAVYDRELNSYAYVSCFTVGSCRDSQGLVVRSESGVEYLYAISQPGYIGRYNVSMLPENMSHATPVEEYDVGVNVFYCEWANSWTVEQKTTGLKSLASWGTSYRSFVFNAGSGFSQKGAFTLPKMMVGYQDQSLNSETSRIPCLMSMTMLNGFLFGGYGAESAYNPLSGSPTYWHNGLALFGKDYTSPMQFLQSSNGVIPAFEGAGYEIEIFKTVGLCANAGSIFSLQETKNPATATSGGLILVEEFSSHPDAINLKSSGRAYDLIDPWRHTFKFDASGNIRNPLSGAVISTLSAAIDFALITGCSEFYIPSGSNLTDANGASLSSCHVNIYECGIDKVLVKVTHGGATVQEFVSAGSFATSPPDLSPVVGNRYCCAAAATFSSLSYANNGGNVKLSSVGVHGLTQYAVSNGSNYDKYIYVSWAGGAGVNGWYKILSIDSTTEVTIGLAYASGFGTPSVALASASNEYLLGTAKTISGGAMGKNGVLKFDVTADILSSANSKTIRAKLGGVNVLNLAMTTSNSYQYRAIIRNLGAENSNVVVYGSSNSYSTSSVPPVHTAINTAVDNDLAFYAIFAAANEHVNVMGIDFNLMRG